MRNLADTLARLSALKAESAGVLPGGDDLQAFADVGSNPGALNAKSFVPVGLRRGAPLVVVLHGCSQSAAAYDHGAGWSALAEQGGFALLFPEQQRANNPNLCFNWFSPDDVTRGRGEACSIMQMIGAFVAAHALDRRRVYITGLSAGGAMTAAMLAAYPEVFAGGAIIAGLPVGAAGSVIEAFDRMRGHGGPGAAQLAASVRSASGHTGAWSAVSIWHGSADTTVAASNGEDLAAQWRGAHGLDENPATTETHARLTRRIWCDAQGRARVQHNLIAGMGHGVPLDCASGVGRSGAYMLDVGVSSTTLIAQSWGLISEVAPKKGSLRADPAEVAGRNARTGQSGTGIQKVIEEALRKAGLM